MSTIESGKLNDFDPSPRNEEGQGLAAPSSRKEETETVADETKVLQPTNEEDEESPSSGEKSPPEEIKRDIVESSPSRCRACLLRFCVVFSCLVISIVLIWLIIYMVRSGFRNETFVAGTHGTCNQTDASSSSSLKVMSFNMYLIFCLPFGIGACEDADVRGDRLGQITKWFENREEDVVFMQEVWSLREELKSGMADEAGFCHYVIGWKKNGGSGLAIFSKYEIIEHDFIDFYDAFGAGSALAPGALNFDAYFFDRGVLYAKISKDGRFIHFFNAHTIPDFISIEHDNRVLQYEVIDDFIKSKSIPEDELVLIGGDLNEDKYCYENSLDMGPVCQDQEYYNKMLDMLSAVDPPLVGDLQFTYISDNDFIESDNESALYDYLLYRDDHLIPEASTSCKIISALSLDGEDLSDHLPLTCDYQLLE